MRAFLGGLAAAFVGFGALPGISLGAVVSLQSNHRLLVEDQSATGEPNDILVEEQSIGGFAHYRVTDSKTPLTLAPGADSNCDPPTSGPDGSTTVCGYGALTQPTGSALAGVDVLAGHNSDTANDSVTIAAFFPATIVGGGGNDSLTGGSGNDTLVGGPGSDTLNGGDGTDTIVANDGVVDTAIDCGAGVDTATFDPADPDAVNCEEKHVAGATTAEPPVVRSIGVDLPQTLSNDYHVTFHASVNRRGTTGVAYNVLFWRPATDQASTRAFTPASTDFGTDGLFSEHGFAVTAPVAAASTYDWVPVASSTTGAAPVYGPIQSFTTPPSLADVVAGITAAVQAAAQKAMEAMVANGAKTANVPLATPGAGTELAAAVAVVQADNGTSIQTSPSTADLIAAAQKLISNDGGSLISNDGASQMDKIASGIISDKGYGLLVTDPAHIVSTSGSGARDTATAAKATAANARKRVKAGAIALIVMVGERTVTKKGQVIVKMHRTVAGKALAGAIRKQNAKRAKHHLAVRPAYFTQFARFIAKGKHKGKRAGVAVSVPAPPAGSLLTP